MFEIVSAAAGTGSKQMYEEGTLDTGVIACSQSIGLVSEIRPVADVIQAMVHDATAIVRQFERPAAEGE